MVLDLTVCSWRRQSVVAGRWLAVKQWSCNGGIHCGDVQRLVEYEQEREQAFDAENDDGFAVGFQEELEAFALIEENDERRQR